MFFVGFHLVFVLLVGERNQSMSARTIQPAQRLQRMRRMFAKGGGILVEDYEHFTRRDVAIPPNKAVRRSAKSHGRQSLIPN